MRTVRIERELRSIIATKRRYLALVEADDGGRYVVKAKWGPSDWLQRVMELAGGELARAFGFNVPEIVLLEAPTDARPISKGIQAQLHYGGGQTVGMAYLENSK